MDLSSLAKSILKIETKQILVPTALLYLVWVIFRKSLEINLYVKDSYLFWIHLIGMLALAYSITLISKISHTFYKDQKLGCYRKNYLKNLSTEEKNLLKEFILKERKTVNLPYQDGTVQNLKNQMIIYQSTSVSDFRMRFDYTIQQWAWDYLNKNKNKNLLKTNNESGKGGNTHNFYNGAE